MICPEVAVNEQFWPGKLKLFKNCWKMSKFAWKTRNFSKICLENFFDP